MEPRYFVTAREGAPEKGPYTLDAIKKSHERQMLGNGALARRENGGETQTISQLLGIGVIAPRDDRAQAEMVSEFARQGAKAAAHRARSSRSTQVAFGAALIVVGGLLTAATYGAASGGGHYVVFTGLFAVGAVHLIRGARGR